MRAGGTIKGRAINSNTGFDPDLPVQKSGDSEIRRFGMEKGGNE